MCIVCIIIYINCMYKITRNHFHNKDNKTMVEQCYHQPIVNMFRTRNMFRTDFFSEHKDGELIYRLKKGVFFAFQILLLTALGVMRVIFVDSKCRIELIPVDYVNNAIIAAGWETARQRAIGENEIKIYTISPSSKNPISFGKTSIFKKKKITLYILVYQLIK